MPYGPTSQSANAATTGARTVGGSRPRPVSGAAGVVLGFRKYEAVAPFYRSDRPPASRPPTSIPTRALGSLETTVGISGCGVNTLCHTSLPFRNLIRCDTCHVDPSCATGVERVPCISMGASIYPEGITEDQAEAFWSEGFQVEFHATYSTISRVLDQASIVDASEFDYVGRITPHPMDHVGLSNLVALDPEDTGARIIRDIFRAAQLMGVDVVWG